VHRLNRQIDQFGVRIGRLQRQLREVHKNFATASVRTQQPSPQPIENTDNEPEKTQETEPPIFITENLPEVIAYYKKLYPNREIIILPPDDVANGIDIEDDMPDIPRRVA